MEGNLSKGQPIPLRSRDFRDDMQTDKSWGGNRTHTSHISVMFFHLNYPMLPLLVWGFHVVPYKANDVFWITTVRLHLLQQTTPLSFGLSQAFRGRFANKGENRIRTCVTTHCWFVSLASERFPIRLRLIPLLTTARLFGTTLRIEPIKGVSKSPAGNFVTKDGGGIEPPHGEHPHFTSCMISMPIREHNQP